MAPAAPSPLAPPLVLVHGMWDTPRLFDRLKRLLAGRRGPLLIPQLPHRFGITPIEEQAELLAMHIEAIVAALRVGDGGQRLWRWTRSRIKFFVYCGVLDLIIYIDLRI